MKNLLLILALFVVSCASLLGISNTITTEVGPFTGVFIAEETSGTAEAAGGLIAGTFITGVAGFFGFFLGIVFLVVGVLIGNNKIEQKE